MDRTLAIETLSPQWLKSDGRANVLLITTGHATNLAIQANSILLDNHNSGTMNSVDAVTKFSPKIQSSNYHHLHIPLLQWADDNPDFQSLSAAITPKLLRITNISSQWKTVVYKVVGVKDCNNHSLNPLSNGTITKQINLQSRNSNTWASLIISSNTATTREIFIIVVGMRQRISLRRL